MVMCTQRGSCYETGTAELSKCAARNNAEFKVTTEVSPLCSWIKEQSKCIPSFPSCTLWWTWI